MIWCQFIFGGHFMHQSNALQKAQRNSRLRMDATSDGIFDYISPTIDDLPGETMRHRIDRWFAKVHPEDLPRLRQRWFEWIKCIDPYEADFRVRSADGSCRRFRSLALAVSGPDSQVRKWYGITKLVDQYI